MTDRSAARMAAVAAAGSALALALYARVAWPWLVLGWVGLVPWLAALDRTRSLGQALVAGLFMCAAFALAVFGWFPSAIRDYTGAPWALAVGILLLVAPILEPQFFVFALARGLALRSGASRWRTALAGAFVYVGAEWLSPKLFADTLGHGLYASSWMRQGADIAGAHGLTFLLLLGNEGALATTRAALANAPLRARLRRACAPAASVVMLVIALLAYGAWRCAELAADGRRSGAVTVGVVQADIDHYDRLRATLGTFEAVRTILDTHFALSAEALGHGDVDFLVWPETVYPTTFGSPKSDDGAAFDREIGTFVARARVPLVFGSYDAEGQDEFNAAVFLAPAEYGPLAFETYRKAWLFPLTERVPAAIDTARVRRWLPWLGTWKPGTGPKVIPLSLRDGRTLEIAPLICYDAVAPAFALAAVRSGADLIVTLSNDSWFTYGDVPRLILIVSAFRSIETRRPQVRATNTGISAVIAPSGALLATAPVHGRAAMVATVEAAPRATTLMVAWGDWFGPVALACGVVLIAARRTSAWGQSSSR